MKLKRFSADEKKLYRYYRKVIDDIRGSSDRIPTLQEIVNYTSLPVHTVISDLQRVRMVGMVKAIKTSDNKVVKVKESPIKGKDYKPLTEKREYLYQKHFLSLPPSERPTLTELSHLVGKSKGIVAKDIRYFERKYNCKFPISDNLLKNLESSPVTVLGVDSFLDTVCSDAYFERLNGYLEYIKEMGYIPTKTEFSRKLGIDKTVVSEDLSYLGLKCMTQNEILETFRKPTEQRALERESFYREHYFESDCPLTLEEMANLLGEFRQVVHREIQYLSQKYKINPKTLEGKRSNFINQDKLLNYRKQFESYFEKKGYIPSETQTSKDLNLSVSLVHMMFKEFSYQSYLPDNIQSPLLFEREPFYQKNYFNSSTPMSVVEMGKQLGVQPQIVYKNLAKLRSKYACSEIDDKCEAYQKLKGDLDYDGRLMLRKGIYKSMLKYNKHYRIKHLCNLFGCHYDVIALDMQKVPILSDIVIR